MQISDEVIKILEYLCSKIGLTIDWTRNNVLPYVEQLCEKYIHWEVSTSFAWIWISLVIALMALVGAIVVYKTDGWDGWEWILFSLIIIGVILVCGTQIFDIIKCKTFPEKAIYDYIRQYINATRKY